MAEELARDGGHELNTEFQYTSWINPTFLSDQPFLPPPFIYPAAFESIVAVSICPVILAVYHDYTGGRTGSIHRHRPSAIQVQVSGAQSFMHAVSKAVVHSTLSLSSSVSSPNFSYLVDALPTHPPARYFPLLDSIPRGWSSFFERAITCASKGDPDTEKWFFLSLFFSLISAFHRVSG